MFPVADILKMYGSQPNISRQWLLMRSPDSKPSRCASREAKSILPHANGLLRQLTWDCRLRDSRPSFHWPHSWSVPKRGPCYSRTFKELWFWARAWNLYFQAKWGGKANPNCRGRRAYLWICAAERLEWFVSPFLLPLSQLTHLASPRYPKRRIRRSHRPFPREIRLRDRLPLDRNSRRLTEQHRPSLPHSYRRLRQTPFRPFGQHLLSRYPLLRLLVGPESQRIPSLGRTIQRYLLDASTTPRPSDLQWCFGWHRRFTGHRHDERVWE